MKKETTKEMAADNFNQRNDHKAVAERKSYSDWNYKFSWITPNFHPSNVISQITKYISEQSEIEPQSKEIKCHQQKCRNVTRKWPAIKIFLQYLLSASTHELQDLEVKEVVIDSVAPKIFSTEKEEVDQAKKQIFQQIELLKTESDHRRVLNKDSKST
eukprot:Awhi_evm2s13382